MKKSILTLAGFTLITLMTTGTNLAFACNIPATHINKKFTPGKTSLDISKIKKLPDLTVTNIQAVPTGQGRCFLRVSVRNNGPGNIPDPEYSSYLVGFTMYINNNRSWMALSMLDAGKKLEKPHHTVTRDWFKYKKNLLQAGLVYNIKMVADSGNELTEANESNNKLATTVECGSHIK